VHVGFAMSRLDEQEAARTLALLRELGVAQGEMEDMAETGELRDPLRDVLRSAP
jgi:hydrogenase expression/formation protein HypC